MSPEASTSRDPEPSHTNVRRSLNFAAYEEPQRFYAQTPAPWHWSYPPQQRSVHTPSLVERPATPRLSPAQQSPMGSPPLYRPPSPTPGPSSQFIVRNPLTSPQRPETPSPERRQQLANRTPPPAYSPPRVPPPQRPQQSFVRAPAPYPTAAQRIIEALSPEQRHQLPVHRLRHRPSLTPPTQHYFAERVEHYINLRPERYDEDTRIGVCRQLVVDGMETISCEFTDGGHMEFHVVRRNQVGPKKTFFTLKSLRLTKKLIDGGCDCWCPAQGVSHGSDTQLPTPKITSRLLAMGPNIRQKKFLPKLATK